MKLLVTGGAGFVGSVTSWRLREAGHEVTLFDNLYRGYREQAKSFPLLEGDVRDRAAVLAALTKTRAEAVLHFAGLALVPESMASPGEYYDVNVAGGLALLSACKEAGVRGIVFSSTCASYGIPKQVPIDEDQLQAPISPYGRSKLSFEWALRDATAAGPQAGAPLGAVALRYFNASGAAPEIGLGEDHRPETHLVPICLLAALGKMPCIDVLGEDYPTPDGTCVRDYVHVVDLADAHVRALSRLDPGSYHAYNLGTGTGTSVRQVIDTVRRVTGRPVPTRSAPRRPGDPPVLVASNARAAAELGWSPTRSGIDQVVEAAWKWRREHPEGYRA